MCFLREREEGGGGWFRRTCKSVFRMSFLVPQIYETSKSALCFYSLKRYFVCVLKYVQNSRLFLYKSALYTCVSTCTIFDSLLVTNILGTLRWKSVLFFFSISFCKSKFLVFLRYPIHKFTSGS